jgi:hypothetical protein
MILPDQLAAACRGVPERMAWLEQLPRVIQELQRRWSLSLGPAWGGREMSCAWVAPAVRNDGTRVVLKLGMPHMEGPTSSRGYDSGTVSQQCVCLRPTLVPMRCS